MTTLMITCDSCGGVCEQDWDLDLIDRVEAILILIEEAESFNAGECWRTVRQCEWRELRADS